MDASFRFWNRNSGQWKRISWDQVRRRFRSSERQVFGAGFRVWERFYSVVMGSEEIDRISENCETNPIGNLYI